jgi:hypothetical protein
MEFSMEFHGGKFTKKNRQMFMKNSMEFHGSEVDGMENSMEFHGIS